MKHLTEVQLQLAAYRMRSKIEARKTFYAEWNGMYLRFDSDFTFHVRTDFMEFTKLGSYCVNGKWVNLLFVDDICESQKHLLKNFLTK